NQLRRMRTNDVRPENLAVLRVANDLHEPIGLARRTGASVVGKEKFADFVVQLLLPTLCFGESDGRDLGMAVRGVRYVPIIDAMRVLAGKDLGDDDAFARTLVRQHWRTGDVTDGVYALCRRLH